MFDVTVTRINDQNFHMLNCQNLSDALSTDQEAIATLLSPLNYDKAFIEDITVELKDFLSQLFKEKDQITFLDKNIKEYKICFHKFDTIIFGFLLLPLSEDEMREIDENSVGKTYLTGDFSDMFKTKKDFH